MLMLFCYFYSFRIFQKSVARVNHRDVISDGCFAELPLARSLRLCEIFYVSILFLYPWYFRVCRSVCLLCFNFLSGNLNHGQYGRFCNFSVSIHPGCRSEAGVEQDDESLSITMSSSYQNQSTSSTQKRRLQRSSDDEAFLQKLLTKVVQIL